MSEVLLFSFVMMFLSLYFIWSRTDYIQTSNNNPLKNLEAYYCGWKSAQQTFQKVEDKHD